MTFFTKEAPASVQPGFGLSQRGRAGLEILGSMQKFSSSVLRERARGTFRGTDEGARLAAEHESGDQQRTAVRDRVARARELAEADPVYRLERFVQRYVCEENFHRGIPAIEERRQRFQSFLGDAAPAETHGSLELDPTVVPPRYYSETEWHLEPGGWDGYDLYGPMFGFGVGPMVFRHGGYAAVGVGDDIVQQRRDVVRQLPKAHYDRVFEPGCGGVSTLAAVHAVFPEAELVGCDVSPLLLKNGYALAQKMGLPVHLKQRDALHCGEPDASFDAVVTYALLHELPPKDDIALFHEIFRVLKPGGDLVMSDPPPFRAVEPFHAAVLDWDTEHRGEPFFSATCLSDWDEELRRIGFVDVQSYALGKDGYPWVTRASKPASA